MYTYNGIRLIGPRQENRFTPIIRMPQSSGQNILYWNGSALTWNGTINQSLQLFHCIRVKQRHHLIAIGQKHVYIHFRHFTSLSCFIQYRLWSVPKTASKSRSADLHSVTDSQNLAPSAEASIPCVRLRYECDSKGCVPEARLTSPVSTDPSVLAPRASQSADYEVRRSVCQKLG